MDQEAQVDVEERDDTKENEKKVMVRNISARTNGKPFEK